MVVRILGAALLLALHGSMTELGAQASAAGDLPAAGTVRVGEFTHGALTRPYRLFVPSARPPAGGRTLLVMLHGCTQDAADFARGTQVEMQAGRHGVTVLWPEQLPSAHPQRCWQWYTPAQIGRDAGESGLIAALIAQAMLQEGIAPSQVVIAGVSAGGAMAANLVAAYPERFAGLMVHSGVPALAADNVPEALGAMRAGPTRASAELAARVIAAMGVRARPLPVLIMHGAVDPVVSVKNAEALEAQWSAVNRAAGGSAVPVELRIIPALGHAWSGGDSRGTFTDPKTPSATDALLAFTMRVSKP